MAQYVTNFHQLNAVMLHVQDIKYILRLALNNHGKVNCLFGVWSESITPLLYTKNNLSTFQN